jgi:hypothetical protein
MGSDERIEIEARVVEFSPSAMYDNYGAGGFAFYDASTLSILSPERLRGYELTIFHEHGTGMAELWREVGSRVAFAIREEYLSGEMVLFDGAVEGLRKIEG